MWRYCYLCGQSKKDDPSIILYSVPKDEDKRRKWVDAVGKHLSPTSFVCSKHFSAESISCNKLLKGSVPEKVNSLSSPASCPIPHPENLIHTPETLPNLFSVIKHNFAIDLPDQWGCHKLEDCIIFFKMSFEATNVPYLEKNIVVRELSISAGAMGKSLDIMESVASPKDLEIFIKRVDDRKICMGVSKSCKIFISTTANLCRTCSKYKYFLRRKGEKKQNAIISKKVKTNYQMYAKRKVKKLEYVVNNLKKELVDFKKIEIFMKKLPPIQQEMIETCYKASQCKKSGKRYTLNWIYSCILMKIKSPKLYNHMRENNILPLPSPSTLSRYIRNIDGSFGFHKEVFSLLKKKSEHLAEHERHGCLLVDECKITPTKKFDKNTMNFVGFIDLGNHTPEIKQDNLGDHALVVMFQPFAGHGLQALACFLSGGDIKGDILAKIILECVILCENSGLYIDVVTSDGATWNRKMWKYLGVENIHEPWCEHPMDSSRKLRMCSDFPHLIKCLRNNLIQKKTFRIPEGLVHYSHFENLLKFEAQKEFRLAFKLTESHIHPKQGEKMNTRLAFQLFSNTVSLALETYGEKYELFQNVGPTIILCQRLNKMIDIMNSSKPYSGLKFDSQEYEDLDTFLVYLDLWQQCSPPGMFLSDSTYQGLIATISCTRDLTK